MKQQVAIIGSGVVGLAVATGLAQLGLRIGVFDARPIALDHSNDLDLRVYAINQASVKLFKQLGVWQSILDTGVSYYQRMYVWDESSNGELCFNSQEIAKPNLGYIIEEKKIRNALLQNLLNSESVTFYQESKLENISIEQEQVYLSGNNIDCKAKLLIGADGANSWVRKHLSFDCTQTPYKHQAIVCHVKSTLSHNQTAFQIFTKEGPLAFLPLQDNHQCSIVWSISPEQAQVLMDLDDSEFIIALEDAFQVKLGHILSVSQRVSFPLIERKLESFIKPRVMLMGDAMHTIHPLAGMGVNLGLADVAAFLKIVQENKFAFDSYRALRAYERMRKGPVFATTHLMQLLKNSFTDKGIPASLRGWGMNLITSTSWIKHKVMQFAVGD